jgi:hypothetical protein
VCNRNSLWGARRPLTCQGHASRAGKQNEYLPQMLTVIYALEAPKAGCCTSGTAAAGMAGFSYAA